MTAPGHPRQLPLHDLHAAAGARFHERLGWSLPADYGDTGAEYEAIRSRAAVLDRSHHSRILVTGTDAGELLAAVFAGHVADLEEGRATRTVALDGDGHITDLVLVARTGGIAYLVAGEPARREDTLGALRAAVVRGWDVRIEDRTATTCLIGVAGPTAAEAVQAHLAEALPVRLQPLHVVTFEFHGFRALAIRTSSTGEDGFEFMFAPPNAAHAIETLVAAGVPLAGDTAQEVARVEACIPAFHPDLEPGLTTGEAGLDALLDLPTSTGAVDRLLCAALLGSAVPVAAGQPLTSSGQRVGEVRSCLVSPALNATIALAIVDARFASPGTTLDAGGILATIVSKPFLRRSSPTQ